MERWVSVQRNGIYRDFRGQIQYPMIMYKRTSVQRSKQISINKIQADNPQVSKTFRIKYNKNNKYNSFSGIPNRALTSEFVTVVVPDYVTLQYDLVIWTQKTRQMNKLIQTINYYSNSYWGNHKLKFKANIQDFTNSTQLQLDSQRIIKTNCTLVMNGYIIPDIYLKHLNYKKKISISKASVDYQIGQNKGNLLNDTQ